jgi:hypothetical protein
MQTKENQGIVAVRLFPEEDFYSSLKKACEKHYLREGIILSGIGQLKNFELGYFREKGDYTPEFFSSAFELVSLTGNIVKEEDYTFHVHACLGNEKKGGCWRAFD